MKYRNLLSHPRQPIVRNLLDTGLAQAAQSFSQIVNREVSVETLCVAISSPGILYAVEDQSATMALLTTDIVGEVGGRSYLLFSEQACAALQDACLSATLDARQRTVMGEAILKEIDNIVSAAMITQLSEALELRIFGGVPQSLRLSGVGIKQRLQEDFAQSPDGCLLVDARFLFRDTNQLQARFFWKFPSEFLHCLENYVNAVHSGTPL